MGGIMDGIGDPAPAPAPAMPVIVVDDDDFKCPACEHVGHILQIGTEAVTYKVWADGTYKNLEGYFVESRFECAECGQLLEVELP